MKHNRVPGHELADVDADVPGGDRFGRPRAGRALCACGELSPVLPSRTQRLEWHRIHKDQIKNAGEQQ